MVAFKFRMPASIAGSYNRTAAGSVVEAGLLLADALPIAYGVPVGIDAPTGKYRGITTGDTADSVRGFIVRPYPTASLGTAGDVFGSGAPVATGIHNIMKTGFLMVTVGGTAAAAKGGTVYVRIAGAAAGKPIGGLEAAADGVNTIALPSSTYWMGPADAQGGGEIGVNI